MNGEAMKRKLQLLIIMLVFLFVSVSFLNAQWTDDTSVNTLVSNAANDQLLSTVYSVGYGKYACIATEDDGFIIAWYDDRNGDYDIYAQKFDAFGYEQWTTNGLAICTATGDQRYAIITTDGDGGAIITWMWDDRNSATTGNDVYGQRVSSNGTIQWTANGVAVCTEDGSQTQAVLVSDDAGGAILSWADSRNSGTTGQDIYAQRINSNGTAQWTAGGVVVCDATANQSMPQIASDEGSGAVITWPDPRSGTTRIYAQKISSLGVSQWTADGVYLGSPSISEEQQRPLIVSDGDGGCIVTWFYDSHSGSGYNYQTCCRGVDSNGTLKWGGVVDACQGIQHYWPSVVSDGAGGVNIAMWAQSDDYYVYAQRIDSDGTRQWGDYGTTICYISDVDQGQATITSDGSSGAILTWRNNINGSTNRDIYAQRIDADGDVKWTANGIAVCSASGNQVEPVIVGNEDGDAFIVWEDDRDSQDDLYCQLVTSSGTFPVTSQQAVSNTGSYTFTNTLVGMNFSALNGSDDVDVLQIPDYPGTANPSTSADVYWRINKGSGISSFTTSITFSYAGHLGSMTEADLKLYRNDGSGWSQWMDFTLDMDNDEITANNVTAFSEWATATEEGTLPVELSSFEALYCYDHTGNSFISINWSTASEIDVIGYNVYRADIDDYSQMEMVNLALIEGHGTTTQHHAYSFHDDIADPMITHYYWLESVDYGGISDFHGSMYYTPGDTDGDHETNTIPQSAFFGAFPNPSHLNTTIKYQLNGSILEQNAEISIYNIKGELVDKITGSNGAARLDVSHYRAGIYLCKVNSLGDKAIKSFIVIK